MSRPKTWIMHAESPGREGRRIPHVTELGEIDSIDIEPTRIGGKDGPPGVSVRVTGKGFVPIQHDTFCVRFEEVKQ